MLLFVAVNLSLPLIPVFPAQLQGRANTPSCIVMTNATWRLDMTGPTNYRAAVKGSVAVIFGIMAAVVLGAAGMAVDFINASNVRTTLQNTLDGAVLAAASAHVKNDHEAETIITEFMTSNWTEKYPTLDIELHQDVTDEVVTGTASVQIPTLLTTVLGIYDMDIAVKSAATISTPTIEVAMVIDNSSSM